MQLASAGLKHRSVSRGIPTGWYALMRPASLRRVPHNPKVAGSNPAPATKILEALLVLSWWGLRVSKSASLHFVQILSRTAAAFGDAGFDPVLATNVIRAEGVRLDP